MAGVWEGERCADGVPAAPDANSVRDCGTVAGPRLLLYFLYIYTRLLIYIHTLLLHRSVCDPSIGRLTEIKTFTSGEPSSRRPQSVTSSLYLCVPRSPRFFRVLRSSRRGSVAPLGSPPNGTEVEFASGTR